MKSKKLSMLGMFLVLVLTVTASALADTITLQDGRSFSGKYIGGTSQTVRFRTDAGAVRTFRIAEIGTIDFGAVTASTPSLPSSSERYGSHSGTHTDPNSGLHSGTHVGTYSADTASRSYPRVAARSEYRVPSGTVLKVRTNETIDSDVANVGDTFSATLDQDVIVNSELLAERGSTAKLRIAEIQEAGTFTGRPSLVIDLVEMNLNNTAYALSSTQVEERGTSQSQRTGVVVGGGAALGALIGAIAGGGKGAAIGAVVGGASGAGYQVLTKGDRLKVPAETVLEFTLQNDLMLRR